MVLQQLFLFLLTSLVCGGDSRGDVSIRSNGELNICSNISADPKYTATLRGCAGRRNVQHHCAHASHLSLCVDIKSDCRGSRKAMKEADLKILTCHIAKKIRDTQRTRESM